MSVLSICSYRFRALLKEISAGIFVEIGKVILKFLWKRKGSRIANIIMKKKKLEDLHYHIAIFILKLQSSDGMDWHKGKQISRRRASRKSAPRVVTWLMTKMTLECIGKMRTYLHKMMLSQPDSHMENWILVNILPYTQKSVSDAL